MRTKFDIIVEEIDRAMQNSRLSQQNDKLYVGSTWLDHENFKKLTTENLSYIRSILEQAIAECGQTGDQTELLYNCPHYDDQNNEKHINFPLKCYLPKNIQELQTLIATNKFVRFFDGHEAFYVISDDKNTCQFELEKLATANLKWKSEYPW